MASLDLNNSYQKAQEKIKSLKTFREISDAAKNLESSNQKIPFDQFDKNLLSPLEKLKEQKKRYQRQGQSQMQNLLSLAKENAGSGTGFIGEIKKKFLEAYTRCEPKIKQIMEQEMLKAVGCSQEQKYNPSSSIYIPVQVIDIFGKLKTDPSSPIGKLLYEKETPIYNEFPFAMNKELYNRTQSPGQTFSAFFGNPYYGSSQQKLFDISYVTQNARGVTGDFFKVKLENRESLGNVGEFLSDYMSTIRLMDSTNLISGISKVAELDGVDDSFFEMTDVDRAIIQNQISNIQLRSLEFVECNNVKVTVDFNNIVNQMVDAITTENIDDPKVLQANIEKIINSASDDPSWKLKIPNDFNVKLKIDEDLLTKIPLAIVASVLSPKVLLPIFIMAIAIGNEYVGELKSLEELQYAMIASLLEVVVAVAILIDDYRKCKSLIDNILSLLSIIGRNLNLRIPYPLMLAAPLLGGTTPEGTTISVIEQLQKFGLPTGPSADGTPNLSLIAELARQKGQELSEAASGFVQVAIPPDIILPSGRPGQLTMSG